MTAPLEHDSALRFIERHFAGANSREDEAAMRAHLGDCEPCAAAYERFRLFSLEDPGAIAAKERIGQALGLAPRRRYFSFTLPAFAGALAAAAVVLVMVRSGGGDDDGFRARGSDVKQAPVAAVFKATAAGTVPVSGSIQASDELAFTYTNPEGRTHLLVFGLDDHQRVYWYHPAWTDPAASPVAVAARRSDGPVELPEAIRHPLEGSTLTIYTVLVDRPVGVREVEAALQAGRKPLLPNADVVMTPLLVKASTP